MFSWYNKSSQVKEPPSNLFVCCAKVTESVPGSCAPIHMGDDLIDKDMHMCRW